MKFLAIALLFAVVALVASDDSGSSEGQLDVQTQRPSRPLADRPNRPNRRPNVSQLFAAFAANGFRPSRRPNRRTTTVATSTTGEMAAETSPAGKQMSTEVPQPPKKPVDGRPERPMRPKPEGAPRPKPEGAARPKPEGAARPVGKPGKPHRRPSTTSTTENMAEETLPAGKQMSTEVPPRPMKPFAGRPVRPEGVARPAGKPNRRPATETTTALPLGKQLDEEEPSMQEPVQGDEKPNRPFFAGPFPALMGQGGQRPGPFGGFGGPRPMNDGQRPGPFGGPRPGPFGGFGGPRPMNDGQGPQIAQFMAGPNGARPNRPTIGDGPTPEMIAQFMAGQRPVGQMGGQRPNRPAGLNNGPMGGRPRPRPTEMPVEPATEQ